MCATPGSTSFGRSLPRHPSPPARQCAVAATRPVLDFLHEWIGDMALFYLNDTVYASEPRTQVRAMEEVKADNAVSREGLRGCTCAVIL